MNAKRILNKKGKLVGLLFTVAILMIVGISLIWQSTTVNAFAMEESIGGQAEQKAQSTATIEDDFTDDIVLVSLTQTATLNFRRYSTADFPEIKLASVVEMTDNLASRAEQQVRNDARGIVATSNNARHVELTWIVLGEYFSWNWQKRVRIKFWKQSSSLKRGTIFVPPNQIT